MERVGCPKLKKAVVSLEKLDLSCEVSVISSGKEMSKEISKAVDSEDPSSENTSSVESNVICTDDDDLEKKIQAFSIPVKKDEKLTNSRGANEPIVCSSKDTTAGEGSESSKSTCKQSISNLKSDSKLKGRKVTNISITTKPSESTTETSSVNSEIENINSGTKINKGRPYKVEIESGDKKVLVSSNKMSIKKEKKLSESGKPSLSSAKSCHSNTSLNTDGKERKSNKGKVVLRKLRKVEQDSTQNLCVRSELSRKRKGEEEDNETNVQPKKSMKRKFQTSSEGNVSAQGSIGKKYKESIDLKTRSDTVKKKILSNSSRVNNDNLKVKRSARIISRDKALKVREKSTREQRKLETRSLATVENRQKLSVVNQKTRSNSKDRNSSSLKSKMENKTASNKVNEKETRANATTKQQSEPQPDDSGESKEKNTKALQNRLNTKNPKSLKHSVNIKKVNVSNIKAAQRLDVKRKSTSSDKNIQGKGIVMHDEGEDLLEKIYDILEDSNGATDAKSVGKGNTVVLQSVDPRSVVTSKDNSLISQSLLLPKKLKENSRFPPDCKGTVPYKKLWKWSHYVRLPSDLWFLYKHFNGNFVIMLHISDSFPFPNLLIDKCVIFNETALPHVKIYGKEVDALGSKDELQTLGQVCSFLKNIHNLSLCAGRSVDGGERDKNCELYTEKNVSLPYKCKPCMSA